MVKEIILEYFLNDLLLLYLMYKQLAKYFTIGVLGTIINLGILYFLVELLDVYYILAATVAYVLAITNNFLWNKKWTFHNGIKKYKKQYAKYFLVSTIGLILTLLLLTFFVEILNIWYILAQVFSIGIVGIGTFLSNKHWTFQN